MHYIYMLIFHISSITPCFSALKHVGVLTKYKILLINICCAFVGLDYKPSSLFMFGWNPVTFLVVMSRVQRLMKRTFVMSWMWCHVLMLRSIVVDLSVGCGYGTGTEWTGEQVVHSLKEIGDFLGGRPTICNFVHWQYPVDVVDGHVGIRQDGNWHHVKSHHGGTLVNGDSKLCACCFHFPWKFPSETYNSCWKQLR
jgi:hypothetical protein